MSTKQKAGILVLLVIVILAVGMFVPSQFNDKYIIQKNKESINKDKQKIAKEREKKQTEENRINNLPNNLDNATFNKRFSKQSDVGKEFLNKYYHYEYLNKNKSFDESLSYLSEDTKADMNTTNDVPINMLTRNVKINSIKPLQEDSDENTVSFEYDVTIKKNTADESIDQKKAKKDEKYLKKIKQTSDESNRTVVLAIDIKSNKIKNIDSNYL